MLASSERYYCVLLHREKSKCLIEYLKMQDFDPDSAYHMALCTVKGLEDGNKFEIISSGRKPLLLKAETEEEKNEWMIAIQERIAYCLTNVDYRTPDSTKDSEHLFESSAAFETLRKIPGNKTCCDCNARGKVQ